MSHKLEEQVSILDAYAEAAMVFGSVEVWNSGSGQPDDGSRHHTWQFFGVPLDSLVKPPTVLPLILRYGTSPCPSGVMVRRKAAQQVGGFDPAFRTMYEDDVFYSKVCLRSSVYVSSHCWTQRREHPGACTSVSDRTGKSRAHRLRYLIWLEQYLLQQPSADVETWKAAQEQLTTYRPAAASRRIWARMEAARDRVSRYAARARRRLLGGSTGTLRATPNPIRFSEMQAAVTNLTWMSAATRDVELRLGAPDGHLVRRSGPSGSATTGDWVNNGMLFYLQDVSDGKPLRLEHTLDIVRVSLLP